MRKDLFAEPNDRFPQPLESHEQEDDGDSNSRGKTQGGDPVDINGLGSDCVPLTDVRGTVTTSKDTHVGPNN